MKKTATFAAAALGAGLAFGQSAAVLPPVVSLASGGSSSPISEATPPRPTTLLVSKTRYGTLMDYGVMVVPMGMFAAVIPLVVSLASGGSSSPISEATPPRPTTLLASKRRYGTLMDYGVMVVPIGAFADVGECEARAIELTARELQRLAEAQPAPALPEFLAEDSFSGAPSYWDVTHFACRTVQGEEMQEANALLAANRGQQR